MTERTKIELKTNIAVDLADNNAGLISAADVRNLLDDIADSINPIIGSGDHNLSYPFQNNVRASKSKGSGYGFFIAESGIQFPNQVGGAGTQLEAYPGPADLDHDDLGGLTGTAGDPHYEYLPVDGSRALEANMKTASYWIGSSGVADRGFKFEYTAGGTTIQTRGDFAFADVSKINTGKSVAKAWLNFDGSGVSSIPVVRSSYNIDTLKYEGVGKYTVTFTSGVFKDNNYVAIGTSNATTASGSMEDFDINTVGLVRRAGDDVGALRTLSFVVRNDAGEYVNAELNDLVVFGLGPGVTADSAPTIS